MTIQDKAKVVIDAPYYRTGWDAVYCDADNELLEIAKEVAQAYLDMVAAYD